MAGLCLNDTGRYPYIRLKYELRGRAMQSIALFVFSCHSDRQEISKGLLMLYSLPIHLQLISSIEVGVCIISGFGEEREGKERDCVGV